MVNLHTNTVQVELESRCWILQGSKGCWYVILVLLRMHVYRMAYTGLVLITQASEGGFTTTRGWHRDEDLENCPWALGRSCTENAGIIG